MADYGVAYSNAANQGAALGGLSSGATGLQQPRSLSSAASRLDLLNEQLSGLRNLANALADQIGGPRPANGINGAPQAEPMGAVARLNDATEHAHSTINDLEETLKSISRALG